jgi:hypothetical protein
MLYLRASDSSLLAVTSGKLDIINTTSVDRTCGRAARGTRERKEAKDTETIDGIFLLPPARSCFISHEILGLQSSLVLLERGGGDTGGEHVLASDVAAAVTVDANLLRLAESAREVEHLKSALISAVEERQAARKTEQAQRELVSESERMIQSLTLSISHMECARAPLDKNILHLREIVDMQKVMLLQAKDRLDERTEEAEQLRAALHTMRLNVQARTSIAKEDEEEEEEDSCDRFNTSGVVFSVRSSPGGSPRKQSGSLVFKALTPDSTLMPGASKYTVTGSHLEIITPEIQDVIRRASATKGGSPVSVTSSQDQDNDSYMMSRSNLVAALMQICGDLDEVGRLLLAVTLADTSDKAAQELMHEQSHVMDIIRENQQVQCLLAAEEENLEESQKLNPIVKVGETRKAEETVFSCEYDCGFTGSFEKVSEHESTCKFNPSQAQQNKLQEKVDNLTAEIPPPPSELVGVGLCVLIQGSKFAGTEDAELTCCQGSGEEKRQRHAVVEAVLEGSPAEVDGRILAGDILISIDCSGTGHGHVSTCGKEIEELMSLVLGTRGTLVDLKLLRVLRPASSQEEGEESEEGGEVQGGGRVAVFEDHAITSQSGDSGGHQIEFTVRLKRGDVDHMDLEVKRLRTANDVLVEALHAMQAELQRSSTASEMLEEELTSAAVVSSDLAAKLHATSDALQAQIVALRDKDELLQSQKNSLQAFKLFRGSEPQSPRAQQLREREDRFAAAEHLLRENELQHKLRSIVRQEDALLQKEPLFKQLMQELASLLYDMQDVLSASEIELQHVNLTAAGDGCRKANAALMQEELLLEMTMKETKVELLQVEVQRLNERCNSALLLQQELMDERDMLRGIQASIPEAICDEGTAWLSEKNNMQRQRDQDLKEKNILLSEREDLFSFLDICLTESETLQAETQHILDKVREKDKDPPRSNANLALLRSFATQTDLETGVSDDMLVSRLRTAQEAHKKSLEELKSLQNDLATARKERVVAEELEVKLRVTISELNVARVQLPDCKDKLRNTDLELAKHSKNMEERETDARASEPERIYDFEVQWFSGINFSLCRLCSPLCFCCSLSFDSC